MATKKSRKTVKKTPKKAQKKTARKPARKAATKAAKKTVRRKAAARRSSPARKSLKTRPIKRTALKKPVKKAVKKAAAPKPAPRLDRERRRLPEAEREDFGSVSRDDRLMNSARSGHDELRSELQKHTESSLELTAGDVDARWQDAYAIGDEAPGGDSPTPDQDRVDDIGKALGVQYDDDDELMGGAEISERDAHRWELDPDSKDDEE